MHLLNIQYVLYTTLDTRRHKDKCEGFYSCLWAACILILEINMNVKLEYSLLEIAGQHISKCMWGRGGVGVLSAQ